jgi:uncharacterized protein (TIGR02301 family)
VRRPVGQRPAALLCLLALVASPFAGPFAVPFAGLTAPALAQQRSGRAAPPAREPAAKEPTKDAPADAPAPYDRDLLRMSEIIGALAFLRGLCGSPDAADWPARMKALIESEGVTPARRDRLAGAYNRGYRGYALTYRVCTPAAHEAAARYVAEGDRLSHALAGRFGG